MWEEDEVQKLMCKQVVDIMSLLATQGDSGLSIKHKQNLLNTLIDFKPITPITFENDDFITPSYPLNGFKQHKRSSDVFMNKYGEITYLNSHRFTPKFHIGKDNKLIPVNKGSYINNGIWVLNKDLNIERYKLGYVNKDKGITLTEPINIDVYEIECPKGWWISFIKQGDLKEYNQYYEAKLDTSTTIDKEINHANGKYKDEIINKINIIHKAMYSE